MNSGGPDQAAGLRGLASTPQAGPRLNAIGVTGGKGGVGKTCLAVNLALALQAQGLRVLLIDFDLSLANADVLLGIQPTATVLEVTRGERRLDEVVCPTPSGLAFVPAASGHDELTRLSTRDQQRLLQDLAEVSARYDLTVIDTAAGIGAEVILPLLACRTVLDVVTPEPTALADAYAVLKVLHQQRADIDLRLVVNQAANGDEAAATAERLRKVAKTYLGRDVSLAGWIPRDRHVGDAVRKRKPFIDDPAAPAAQAVRGLATGLARECRRR